MIKAVVVFSESELSLSKNYVRLAGKSLDGNYWSHDDCYNIRLSIKQHYLVEQDYRCCYCKQEIRVENGRAWDVEHIVPKSLHPLFMFEPYNLAASCIDCNSEKLNKEVMVNPHLKRYPKRSEAYKIVHPHFDIYDIHIDYSVGKFYFANDDKGNNTIIICNLSRFTYKYGRWPQEFSKIPNIMNLIEELKNITDEREAEVKVMEIQLLTSSSFP